MQVSYRSSIAACHSRQHLELEELLHTKIVVFFEPYCEIPVSMQNDEVVMRKDHPVTQHIKYKFIFCHIVLHVYRRMLCRATVCHVVVICLAISNCSVINQGVEGLRRCASYVSSGYKAECMHEVGVYRPGRSSRRYFITG